MNTSTVVVDTARPDASDVAGLRAAWRALAGERLRQRDIAARLGLGEAALPELAVGAHDGETPARAVRLSATPASIDALLAALPTLGRVMALTRNESCVHEKIGRYEQVQLGRHASLVLGPDIDLRLFQRRWTRAFAVTEPTADGGTRRSLQCFLADGSAAHKVFLREDSDLAAWAALVDAHRAVDQSPALPARGATDDDAPAADATAADLDRFRADWLAMRDTHEFFGLLSRHGLARTAALRAAPDGHANRVPDDAARQVLERAAATDLPIMVFTGNPGCIQIHTGPVRRVRPTGPWLNVLDAGFNLHLRTDAVAESWVVRKPTDQGMVTSLELFDAAGRTIAMFFGARKPDRPELAAWRALMASVERGTTEARA